MDVTMVRNLQASILIILNILSCYTTYIINNEKGKGIKRKEKGKFLLYYLFYIYLITCHYYFSNNNISDFYIWIIVTIINTRI